MSNRDIRRHQKDEVISSKLLDYLKDSGDLYERIADNASDFAIRNEESLYSLQEQLAVLKKVQKEEELTGEALERWESKYENINNSIKQINAENAVIYKHLKDQGMLQATQLEVQYMKDKKILEDELENKQLKLRSVSIELNKKLTDPSASTKEIDALLNKQLQAKKEVSALHNEIQKVENEHDGKLDVTKFISAQATRAKNKVKDKTSDLADKARKNSRTSNLMSSLDKFTKTTSEHVNKTGSFLSELTGKAKNSKFGQKTSEVVSGKIGAISKATDLISGGVSKISNTLSGWVDGASNTLKDIYGNVNANLEGSGKTFDSIEDTLSKAMGEGGTLFKQSDYLSKIAQLSGQGIANNIEQRALLAQMASKTVSQFSITNGSLLRLIRLRKQDMSAQIFGMESALKRALNAQFGDSSYLNELFDSVTSSLVDAVSTNKWSEATPFYSVLQSYLGSMHESGVGSDFVNSIAKGINALGSGNVADLQSNEAVNRLFLLSMERIGMDYADVLQNGLSADKADALLNSVITYLKQISKNTNENNVLKNSYSKLFNLSMADMRAIEGLKPVRLNMTDSKAIQETRNQLRKVNQRTLVSEQINNLMENAKFAFGENIATSKGRYLTFKTSSTILDFINSISGSTAGKVASGSGPLNAILKVAKAGAVLGVAGSSLLPAVNMIKSVALGARDVVTGNSSDITNLFDMTNTSSSWESKYASLSKSSVYGGRSNSNYNNFKKLASRDSRYKENIDTSDKSWEEDDKDETLEILKELEQTIMENKEGRKALAVSVEAMSNDVLRSFASIFSDEDSMEETFSGENEVLKKALFEYADDKTSSSNREKKADKTFATSPKGLSKANK